MKNLGKFLFLILGLLIGITSLNQKVTAASFPLGIANNFKFFAPGTVTLEHSISSNTINSKIAANKLSVDKDQANDFYQTANLNPALVLGSIDSSDDSTGSYLIRSISQLMGNQSSFIADNIPSSSSSLNTANGSYLWSYNWNSPANITSNFQSFTNRKNTQFSTVASYFNSLNSEIPASDNAAAAFTTATTQLRALSTYYADSQANVINGTYVDNTGIERFDISLPDNYQTPPLYTLNVDSTAKGISIHITNQNSNESGPYFIVNWKNRSTFNWTDQNSYSITTDGNNYENLDWASHVINNFPDSQTVRLSNSAGTGEEFLGSIFAPKSSDVILGNYGTEKTPQYITNVISGGNIEVWMNGAAINNIISTDFPKPADTTPQIKSVEFSSGSSTSTVSSNNGSSTLSKTNDDPTSANILVQNLNNNNLYVKANDNTAWTKVTEQNGRFKINDISHLKNKGYNNNINVVGNLAATESNNLVSFGLKLQRINTLTFAISSADNASSINNSNILTSFTATVNESGNLTAKIPNVTFNSVPLGSKNIFLAYPVNSASTSQPTIEINDDLGASNNVLNLSLEVGDTVDSTNTTSEFSKFLKNMLSNKFNQAESFKTTVDLTNFSGSDSISWSLSLSGLANNNDLLKEVTPGDYTTSLHWTMSLSDQSSS